MVWLSDRLFASDNHRSAKRNTWFGLGTASLRGLLAWCLAGSVLWGGCSNLVPGPQAFASAGGTDAAGDAAGADGVADSQADSSGTDDALEPADTADGSDVAAQTDGTTQTDSTAETDTTAQTDAAAETDVGTETDAQIGSDAATGECKTKADCAGKDDGNLCNGTWTCDLSGASAVCVFDPSTVVSCDDNNPCTSDSCAPATGQCSNTAAAQNSPCDDGDPCTITLCDAGTCKETEYICACKTSADCADEEAMDGNLCNGVFYCHPVSKTCEPKPGSAVNCGTSADTPCAKNTCNPQTGQCQMVPVPGFLVPCTDNNPCTTGDVCEDGQCVAGTNTCTCVKDADCASEEDGNPCNGTLFCDKSQLPPVCKVNPKTVVSCPSADNTDCKQTVCNPTSGACEAKSAPDNQLCDDDDPCTQPGSCKSGSCVQSPSSQCGCLSDADCPDDNNQCNGERFCNTLTKKCEVNPFTVVTCPDGDDTACIRNTCNPASGQCAMQSVNEGKLCEADGTACTQDACSKGSCVLGTNLCSCTSDMDCLASEDGNLCNGTLFCDKSVEPATCKVNPATVKSCPTANNTACFAEVCEPKTGQCQGVNKPDNTLCDDGVSCTLADTCQSGQCTAGTNLCGCTADADCFDPDNDKCTGVPYCDKSSAPFVCKTNPATVVDCPAGGLGCAQNTCNSHTGTCAPAPNAGACDDSNPCTIDACDGNTGACSHINVVETTPCAGGTCVAGSCTSLADSEVAVPGGPAQVGCNLTSSCPADELPQHGVTLKTFAIDRLEVTVAQYKACVDSGNCTEPAGSDPACNWGKETKSSHPVTCVQWAQAVGYCQWQGKRLPSEAEWEVAARGACGLYASCASQTPQYPWGNETPTCSWTVMFGDALAGCDLGTTKGAGVQSNDRSPYQVGDLGGNAREWTQDWYDAGYYATSPSVSPTGPTTGTSRVARGGSWQAKLPDMRASDRHPLDPTAATPDLGFRCARTLGTP